MDTKKIGTFTSMNRKKKGYTQGQLAEKLGVTIDPFLAEESGKQGNQSDTDEGYAATGHQLLHTLRLSSLRIKKQGEVKNFCRSHPAGPRRIGLAQSSGKSTLPTKE